MSDPGRFPGGVAAAASKSRTIPKLLRVLDKVHNAQVFEHCLTRRQSGCSRVAGTRVSHRRLSLKVGRNAEEWLWTAKRGRCRGESSGATAARLPWAMTGGSKSLSRNVRDQHEECGPEARIQRSPIGGGKRALRVIAIP